MSLPHEARAAQFAANEIFICAALEFQLWRGEAGRALCRLEEEGVAPKWLMLSARGAVQLRAFLVFDGGEERDLEIFFYR